MHFAILITAAAIAICGARPSEDVAWENYKLKFDKVYKSEEEENLRYGIWKKNVQDVYTHNAALEHSYEIGVNQFSDMTDEEFESKMLRGLRIPEHILYRTQQPGPVFEATNQTNLDEHVDWAQKGYVTPIKNQGDCGSCYAFAATGSLEGQWFRKSGELSSLSEQQIVDCSGDYGNEGCSGGWYHDAWDYIRDAGGSDSEDSYPYRASVHWCRFSREHVVAETHGTQEVRANDENALKEAVATIGPIAVAISVSGGFGRYKHGVYYNPSCHNDIWHLNHAVLVVGYGTENGQDYWLVKNSWGDWWGQNGYVKMARNRNNNCGIACKAAYPVV